MARKKRRRGRGGGASGAELEERRRERLEARRQAKAEAEAARRRKQRRERLIRRAGLLAVAAVVFWFLFLRGGLPSEINGHPIRTFNVSLDRATGGHTPDPVTYESTPPVAGPHNPRPAPCGTYAEPVPGSLLTNETMVHTLEHGAVGILYDPTLDPQQIEQIEEIVRGFDDHVFSAPYSGMDTPIALTAWEHLLKLDEFERPTIDEFIDVFAEGGSAPEANQDCPNSQDDSFEPQPSPSPSPEVTPGEGGEEEGEDGDRGARDKKGDSKND